MSEEKKEKNFTDRDGALRKKYSALLAGVKLRPPALPQVPVELPGNAARRYPVLQELSAARQDIHDEFSKMQLDLSEIRSRVEEDQAAITKGAPVKPRETIAAGPVEEPVAARAPAAPQPPAKPVEPEPALRSAAGFRLSPERMFFAAAVCAAAFGLFRFYGGAPAASFALPPTRAAGLCTDRDGAHVYFADPQRQLLFTFSVREERIRAMQSFPSQGLKGLAFDGTSFWSSDGSAIYRHGTAGNYAVLDVYKAGPEVSSISWDGKHLWAVSAGGKLTRYLAGETLAQEGVYRMPEGRTAGISISDGKLWLLDPESGRLSAYKPGVKPELLSAADIKSLLPSGAVSGFSVAGDHLWVITEDPSVLARIDLKVIKFS